MKKIEFGELHINDISKRHIQDCLDSNWVTMGNKTKLFEEKWSKLFDYPYTVAFNSGTSADMAACMALYELPELDAKPGDEIICPALSFIATANAIRVSNFVPKFVDVDYQTLNIDIEQVGNAITKKTKAIMGVNLMGKPCRMDILDELCSHHDIPLIIDNCLLPGQKIITDCGMINIENIKTQHKVLTHMGRYCSVSKTMNKQYDGQLVKIRAYGSNKTLTITEDHPVLIAKTCNIRQTQDLKWSLAKDITDKDYLVYPRFNVTKDLTNIDGIDIDTDILTLCGWYLAEGSCYRQHVELHLGHHETDNINNILQILHKLQWKYKIYNRTTTIGIHIFNKTFKDFLLKYFKTGSSNKQIPLCIKLLPAYKLKTLLHAYILGDGCKIKNRHDAYSITSVSLHLLTDVKEICAKLGYNVCIGQTRKAGVGYILGRQVNLKDTYILRFSQFNNNQYERRYFIDDKYIYYRVKNVEYETVKNKLVYNLEIEQDNSYCVETWAIHNCEAYGCKLHNRYSLSYCMMETTSFYVAHLVTAGEGSVIACDEEYIRNLLQSIRSHGRAPDSQYFDHKVFGLNLRPTDLHMSIGLGELEHFGDNFQKRKANLYKMREAVRGFEDLAWFVEEDEDAINAPHAFSITIKPAYSLNIKNLKLGLDEAGIQWKRNFGSQLHHRAFSYLQPNDFSMPRSQYIGNHGIHIGCHQYLSEEDLEYVCITLKTILGKMTRN